MRVVYQRLMKQKPNSSELELDAAAEVKQVSPTVIEFRLKPGQMFTDGFGEMTADDVKFSFERIGLPAEGRRVDRRTRTTGCTCTGVEVKSKYEGRIVLSQPRANLFDVVIGDGSGCIVSRKAVEQRGADFATKPVGSGPYQLVSLERQKGAMLRRNPAYAGRKPHYEEIAIRFISDARTTDLALRSGELDFAVLSPSAAEPLRAVAGLTVNEQPSIAYVWLGMNVEKAPFDRSARAPGDPPRARRRPDAGGGLQRQGAAPQHAAAAADPRPLARGAGLQAQRGGGEEPARRGGRVQPQAQAADPEPGRLPEHGAGGARAAGRRRHHGRGRRAGGRHATGIRARATSARTSTCSSSASTASTIRTSSCSGSSPGQIGELELAALEQPGVRRAVRAVGGRDRSGQAAAAGRSTRSG